MTFFKSVTALTVKASLIACATFVAAPLGAGAAAAQDTTTCVYSGKQKVCGPEFAPDGTIFVKDYGDYQQHRDPIYRTKSQPGKIRFCLVNQTGTRKTLDLGVRGVNVLNAAPGAQSCASINIQQNPDISLSMTDDGRALSSSFFQTSSLGGQLIIFRWTR